MNEDTFSENESNPPISPVYTREVVVFEETPNELNGCPVCENCAYTSFERRPMKYYQDNQALCVGHSIEYLSYLKRWGLLPDPKVEA